MQYIVYNATKNVRLPSEFEYRDALFSRSSLGRILRMLLDTEWSGDRIAILPTDKWEKDQKNLEKADITNDPVEAPVQNIVFLTYDADIPEYVVCEEDYVKFDSGSVYNYDKEGRIDRFDTLIPLISIDPPPHLMESLYVDMNGRWAFMPLRVQNVKPKGEDLSARYDVENFYRDFPNDVIHRKVSVADATEDGLWVGDLIGLIEM